MGLKEFMTCPGPHTGLKLRSTASSSNGHYTHGHSRPMATQTNSINSTWKLETALSPLKPCESEFTVPKMPQMKVHTLEFREASSCPVLGLCKDGATSQQGLCSPWQLTNSPPTGPPALHWFLKCFYADTAHYL